MQPTVRGWGREIDRGDQSELHPKTSVDGRLLREFRDRIREQPASSLRPAGDFARHLGVSVAQWCVLVYMSIGEDVTDALDDLDEAQEAAVDWNTDDIQAWFLLNTDARGVVATPRAGGLARTEVGPTSLVDFVASKQDVWNECPKRALVLWGHGNPRPRSWGTSEVGVAPSPPRSLLPSTSQISCRRPSSGTTRAAWGPSTSGTSSPPCRARRLATDGMGELADPQTCLGVALRRVVQRPGEHGQRSDSAFARLAVTRYAASVGSSSYSIAAYDRRGFPSVPETVTSPAIVGLTDAVAALVADLTRTVRRSKTSWRPRVGPRCRMTRTTWISRRSSTASTPATTSARAPGRAQRTGPDDHSPAVTFRPGQAQIWGLSVPLPDSRRPQAATLFGPIPAAGGDRSTFSLDSGWAMSGRRAWRLRRRRRS